MSDTMFKEIVEDINDRISGQPNSLAASPDEVRICWLTAECARLYELCEKNNIDHKYKFPNKQ